MVGENLFVTDSNHTIRKIISSSGVVTTLAGSVGIAGSNDGNGKDANFWSPHGITNDGINIYVAGYTKHTIRNIKILSDDVTTIAGSAHES